MEIVSGHHVKDLKEKKQRLEIDLCKDLLEIFNDQDQGLIGPLRDMVHDAIEHMVSVSRNYGTSQAFTAAWIAKWQEYAGVKENKLTLWDCESTKRAHQRCKSFKAEHCGDWIRIYGEVVEDVLKGKDDELRTSYQKGTSDDPRRTGKKTYEFRKGKGDNPSQGRMRVKSDENPDIHKEYVKHRTQAWRDLRKKPSAGICRWDMKENDPIGKIDQVFGLTYGATISGTTTDNIYFIDKFKRFHLNPVFYLLPAATLVSGGHHTLLEVAYPLALNELVDYRIGRYSTLKPLPLKEVALPYDQIRLAGAKTIENKLEMFDADPDNHLMLIWYRAPETPGGAVLMSTNQEFQDWRQIFRASKTLLATFSGLRPWPRYDDIKRILAEWMQVDLEELVTEQGMV